MQGLLAVLQELGQQGTLAYEQWPSYDEKLLVSDTFNLPIQVRHHEFASVESKHSHASFQQDDCMPALLKHNLVSKLLQSDHLASGQSI